MPGRMTPTVPVLFFLATFCLLITASPCPSLDKASSNPAQVLMTLGEIGPSAVQLRAWTNKPPEYEFSTGDRVQIHFLADRDCHLAILNVSKSGNAVVLFPNRETPNNLVKGGMEYALFGDDSSMKLVVDEGLSESKIVFYVSAEPFSLGPVKVPEGKAIIKLSAGDNDWNILTSTLREVSKKSGYNRVLLSIKVREKARGPKLMAPAPPKAAPRKSESEIPETVTGSQGLKPQVDRQD